jgi:putative acetyltransferase
MLIRAETPADRDAIRDVNRQAFGGEAESRLIDRLRSDGDVVISLVAQHDDRVVGHILFSELTSETTGGSIKAAALAPMAVVPEFQERGIGTALVERGLALCREHGYTVIVVLGHPDYYPRFGFSRDKGQALQSPYSGLGEAYMALELVPGALEGVTGTVRYPQAFTQVD